MCIHVWLGSVQLILKTIQSFSLLSLCFSFSNLSFYLLLLTRRWRQVFQCHFSIVDSPTSYQFSFFVSVISPLNLRYMLICIFLTNTYSKINQHGFFVCPGPAVCVRFAAISSSGGAFRCLCWLRLCIEGDYITAHSDWHNSNKTYSSSSFPSSLTQLLLFITDSAISP